MKTVRTYATSANLGPGFDCLGVCFDIYNEYNFEEGQLYFISGPMAGYDNWNKEAFDKCEKRLRSELKASYVYNPAKRIKDENKDFTYYMREPLHVINMYQNDWENVIDAVILLPGWQKSLGSVTEALVAHEVGIDLVIWKE